MSSSAGTTLLDSDGRRCLSEVSDRGILSDGTSDCPCCVCEEQTISYDTRVTGSGTQIGTLSSSSFSVALVAGLVKCQIVATFDPQSYLDDTGNVGGVVPTGRDIGGSGYPGVFAGGYIKIDPTNIIISGTTMSVNYTAIDKRPTLVGFLGVLRWQRLC